MTARISIKQLDRWIEIVQESARELGLDQGEFNLAGLHRHSAYGAHMLVLRAADSGAVTEFGSPHMMSTREAYYVVRGIAETLQALPDPALATEAS